MRAFALGIVGAALCSTAAMAADEPKAAAKPAVATAAGAGDQKVVCRSESVLGSMTRRVKTCRTLAEWRDVHNQTRDITERTQQRGAH